MKEKAYSELKIEENYLNIIKIIYEKPKESIPLNGERLKTSHKIKKKARMPLLITSLQCSIRRSYQSSKARKINKCHQRKK
jgi:hypothetical protein